MGWFRGGTVLCSFHLLGNGVAATEQLLHAVLRRSNMHNCATPAASVLQDGGYHVSVAHPELAASLDLASYTSNIYETLSIQSCQPRSQDERLAGRKRHRCTLA